MDSYDRCGAVFDRASRLLLRSRAPAHVIPHGRRRGTETDTRARRVQRGFLAVPIGVAAGKKARVVAHLGEHMAAGVVVVARSAQVATASCAPSEPADVGRGGFHVLAVHHSDNHEVINSIIVARKGVGGGRPQPALPVVSQSCKCCAVKTLRRRLLPTSCHLDAMKEIRRRTW